MGLEMRSQRHAVCERERGFIRRQDNCFERLHCIEGRAIFTWDGVLYRIYTCLSLSLPPLEKGTLLMNGVEY